MITTGDGASGDNHTGSGTAGGDAGSDVFMDATSIGDVDAQAVVLGAASAAVREVSANGTHPQADFV